jgi:hypothetical protein
MPRGPEASHHPSSTGPAREKPSGRSPEAKSHSPRVRRRDKRRAALSPPSHHRRTAPRSRQLLRLAAWTGHCASRRVRPCGFSERLPHRPMPCASLRRTAAMTRPLVPRRGELRSTRSRRPIRGRIHERSPRSASLRRRRSWRRSPASGSSSLPGEGDGFFGEEHEPGAGVESQVADADDFAVASVAAASQLCGEAGALIAVDDRLGDVVKPDHSPRSGASTAAWFSCSRWRDCAPSATRSWWTLRSMSG